SWRSPRPPRRSVDPPIALQNRVLLLAQQAHVFPGVRLKAWFRRHSRLLIGGQWIAGRAPRGLPPREIEKKQPDQNVDGSGGDEQAQSEDQNPANVDVAAFVTNLWVIVMRFHTDPAQGAVEGRSPARSTSRPSASSNCGSWTGRIARPRSCQTKQPSQNALSEMGSTTSSQLTTTPSRWNSGATSQYKSTRRRTRIKYATLTNMFAWRLIARDSKRPNGTTKC